VWSDEIDKFSRFHNLTIQKMIGDPETRLAALNTPADIYTINYENLPWLVDLCEDFWPFKIIISDESTALKGFRLRHGGKRAGALAKAAKYTARWINLTGSPSPNGLIDLWGQCWFIDMGQRLGTSFSDFKKRWFDEDKYAHSITPKSFAETQITELIADVTYSLRADEVFDLEPILHNPIYVELPPKARALYDQMENEMCIAFGDGEEVEAKTAADLSLKTLQIASGALYRPETTEWETIHDEKIMAAQELLDELSGNPLLIAYHFQHDVKRLLAAIPGSRVLKSKQDEDDWNAGKIRCGIMHPASGGHGLNLQDGGHNIAFFSHWWNLEHFQQVIERIGPVRQMQSGYQRRVMVHYLIARGTTDETVMRRRETKRSVQDLVRERVENIRAFT
jgi:SNF2 family DNA or RNA helicase